MGMQETARFITGLRSAGWDEKRINDFIMYIGTGDEKYKPQDPDSEDDRLVYNRKG